MNKHVKHKAQDQVQQTAEAQTQAAQAAEFPSVEDMLRHDALHTPVPPRVLHRLRESLGPRDAPAAPWWKRLFGGRTE